jgi:hypothetical protein
MCECKSYPANEQYSPSLYLYIPTFVIVIVKWSLLSHSFLVTHKVLWMIGV